MKSKTPLTFHNLTTLFFLPAFFDERDYLWKVFFNYQMPEGKNETSAPSRVIDKKDFRFD